MAAAADVILAGGTVLTMDESPPPAQRGEAGRGARQGPGYGAPAASSLALRDGRVLAVGGGYVLSLRSDRTELIAQSRAGERPVPPTVHLERRP